MQRWCLVGVVWVCGLVVMASGIANATPDRTVTVDGNVVRANGDPIPDAEVVVSEKRDAVGKTGKTDAQGRFSVAIATQQKTLWCRVQLTGYDSTQLQLSVRGEDAHAATIKLTSPLEFGIPIVAAGDPSTSAGLILTLPVKHNGKEPITFRELQLDGIIDKTPSGSCADPSSWMAFELADEVSVEHGGRVGVQIADANTTYFARAAQLRANYNGCSGGDYSIVMSGPSFSIPPRSQAKTDYHIEIRLPANFRLVEQGSPGGGSPKLVISRCPAGATCRALHATLRTVGNSAFRTPDVTVQSYMSDVPK